MRRPTCRGDRRLVQVGGAIGRFCEELRGDLLALLADVEVGIDFSDDEPAAGVVAASACRALVARIDAQLDAATSAERIRSGLVVVILGRPNVGKSSLFNALVEREVAIVTATPGTTRDLVEAHLDVRGVAVTLVDSAGLP